MLKFKIDSTDMGAIAGRIREAGTWIKTPTRVLSSREINHGKKILNDNISKEEFAHPLYEITRYFQKRTVDSFLNNAEVSYKIQKQLESASKDGNDRITFLHSIFDKQVDINDELNMKWLELQLQINVDAVEILDGATTSPLQYDNRIKKSVTSIDSDVNPLEPLAVLRMDCDEKIFTQKLKILKDRGIKMVNAIYTSPLKYLPNFVALSKFAESNDIWVHMSEAERYWRGDYKTSMVHMLPFLAGVSSFSLVSKPFRQFGLFKVVPKPAKRFDGRCLGHLTSDEHEHRYGEDLGCNCFVDNGKTKKDFYDNYSGSELLNSALVCHEANGSLNELMNFRKHILQSSCKDYIREKEFMKGPFKRILGIDLNNTSLNF